MPFRIAAASAGLALLLAPLFASAATCPPLTRGLSFGVRGTDVVALQDFLIAADDLASGNNTGFFGRLTEAAVQKWQARAGVISSGSPLTGFGVVGPKTRAAITLSCTHPSDTPTDIPVAPTPPAQPTSPQSPGAAAPPAPFSATPRRCIYHNNEQMHGYAVLYNGGSYTCEDGLWFEPLTSYPETLVDICERADGTTRDTLFDCLNRPVSNIKFGVRPSYGSASLAVSAAVSAFVAPSNQCGTGVLDWGDGTTDRITAPATCPATAHYEVRSHSYTTTGSYTVRFVADSNGETETRQVSVVSPTAYRTTQVASALTALESALQAMLAKLGN